MNSDIFNIDIYTRKGKYKSGKTGNIIICNKKYWVIFFSKKKAETYMIFPQYYYFNKIHTVVRIEDHCLYRVSPQLLK
jgi:hypothetical protein